MKGFAVLCAVLVASAQAFVPVSRPFRSVAVHQNTFELPPAVQRARSSVAPVQTMGMFGLGAPEIGVILIAAAFLLGPEKLAELGKDAGKIAGELKEVPKEFQEGLKEGEMNAKKMKLGDAEDAVKETVPDAVKEVEKKE